MSSLKKGKKPSISENNRFFPVFSIFGYVFFACGLAIFILTFFPVLKEEVKYLAKNKKTTGIIPVDREFGIVIPKIKANAKIISNVNPYNADVYQKALTQGVAHAAGTAFPGHAGNSFLFAHSSVDWYIANRYNSVFYLINKLERGDKIEAYYKGKKYTYEVFDKLTVGPEDVSYLDPGASGDSATLTLMTCWPPGTSVKRLIIKAKII